MTSRHTWKKWEQTIAEIFGTERNSKKGQGLPVPDVIGIAQFKEAVALAIECKFRKTLPKDIKDAIKQAQTNCSSSRIPIVFMKEKFSAIDDALVVMTLKDFKRLLKEEENEKDG